MTLKTQIASMNSTVFMNTDYFAEAGEYTPKGGTMVSLNADWKFENLMPELVRDGEFEKLVGEVMISRSDIESPKPDDKIKHTDLGVTFNVEYVVNMDASTANLSIKEIKRTSVASMKRRK